MIDSNLINELIVEYKKSIIQSEEEVRSKLLTKLIEILGYPTELRAENYPVHSFQGVKLLDTTYADYILFSDKHFAKYRESSDEHRNWVYAHSLLICEAKKPGKLPRSDIQAQFYSAWTRTPAYIICDGLRIRAYYYRTIGADKRIIDCSIEELPSQEALNLFSFEHLMEIKEAFDALETEEKEFVSLNPQDMVGLGIPQEVIDSMRKAWRLPEHLSDYDVLSNFLKSTDACLERDLRYNIPEFMLDVPRSEFSSRMFIDDDIIPSFSGTINKYYWEDIDKIEFSDGQLSVGFVFQNKRPAEFQIGYIVQDNSASTRLSKLKRMRRVFDANVIRFEIDGMEGITIEMGSKPFSQSQEYLQQVAEVDFWIEEMKKIEEIERYYGVKFVMRPLPEEEDVLALYQAVDCVHSGIVHKQNCILYLQNNPCIRKSIKISEPFPFDKPITGLPTIQIHNVRFRPSKSLLLPFTIKRSMRKTKVHRIPASCIYCVCDENCDSSEETEG